MNDIPDWAGKRACELLNEQPFMKRFSWPEDAENGFVHVVAKLVMQHETAPIDPDEEAVKRIIAAYFNNEIEKILWAHDHLPRAVSQYKQEKANG